MTTSYFSNKTSNLDTVKLLLERKANPFEKDPDNHDTLVYCQTNECRQLINEYIWKWLYNRDRDTAKRYAKQTQISKDVWELILLNKRQQQLCQNLSSDKNKEILKFFAMEFDIPITEDMTKAKLCGLISRQLVYGKKYMGQAEWKMRQDIGEIKQLALRYGLDPNLPVDTLLIDLASILK